MDVKLIVVGGKASKGAIPLKLPTVVGRSRDADLTVSHPMVSRRHCEIFDDEGLLSVRDLDSLNGTIVNGQRVSQAAIRPDDEFTVGPLTFRAEYRYDGPIDGVPAPKLDMRPAQQLENAEPQSLDKTPKFSPLPGSDEQMASTTDFEKPADDSDQLKEADDLDTDNLDTDDSDDGFDAFLQGLQED